VAAAAGICKFFFWQETWPLIDFINAVTGWDFNTNELLLTGERIQTLRQLFSLREGLNPDDLALPHRLAEPATTGPYKDVHVDLDLLRRQYYEAIGWDPNTGYPTESRLKELGIQI
jgi:aldehyde:ferredoxin oxidoreductase